MFIHYVNLDAWRLFGTIKGRRKCPTNNTAFKEGFKSLTNKDSLILQWISERPVAKISKWSHLTLCPVYSRTDFLPCSWPCIAFLVDMNTARVLEKVLKSINQRVYQNLISQNDENVQRWSTPLIRWVTSIYSPLWKRVIAWERSHAASGYGIIWGDADRNKQEEFSAECHSVDCF